MVIKKMAPKKTKKTSKKVSYDTESESSDEELSDTSSVNEKEEEIDEDDEGEFTSDNDEVDYDEDEDVASETEYKNEPKDDDDDCFYEYDNNEDKIKETMVTPEERITTKKLTKYERVRILGVRAKQISMGAKVMVKGVEGKSPMEIAVLELQHKMIPFVIKRPLPNHTYELWKLSELEIDN